MACSTNLGMKSIIYMKVMLSLVIMFILLYTAVIVLY